MLRKILIILVLTGCIFYLLPQGYGESDDFSYALKLYNEGYYDIAAQQFNLFVNRYPQSDRVPDARYYQAMTLFRLKDYANARIEFQALAVGFPDHNRAPEAWEKLGACYLKLGKFADAGKAFETVKILYPDNASAPEALYQAALSYYRLPNLNKTDQILREFLDRYPESPVFPKARLLYGRLLVQKGNYDLAKNEFEKVLATKASADILAEAHFSLAEFYEKLGQVQRAQKEYMLISSQYSRSNVLLSAVLNNARLAAKTNDFVNAGKILTKYTDRFKTSEKKARLKLALAAIQYLSDDYLAARQNLESIPGTGLNDSLSAKKMFYLGTVLYKEKKWDRALEQFNNLLKNKKIADVEPGYYRESERLSGYVYLQKRDFRKANNLLTAYLKKYSQNSGNDKIIIDLFYAALQNKNPSVAEKKYEQLIADFPQHSERDELLYSLGKYYFKQNNYTKSQAVFSEFCADYYCSASYDSASQFIQIIKNSFNVDQNLGVQKLARLVGRVIAQEDLQKLKLELAQIYLNQLKDFPEAIRLARSLLQSSSAPDLIGNAYFLIGECYRRQGNLKTFLGKDGGPDLIEAQQAYKNAMEHIDAISDKDSLAYLFLALNTEYSAGKKIPPEKQIQFWQHFVSTYPPSDLVDRGKLHLADLYSSTQNFPAAQAELASVFQAGNSVLSGEAYFKSGKIFYQQNQLDAASGVLKEFLLNHKVHPKRAKALAMLAEINEKEGNYVDAAQFWIRVKEQYNYSEVGVNAFSHIPEILLLAGKNQGVLSFTQPFLADNPSDDLVLNSLRPLPYPAFHFFAGKAYFESQKYNEAREMLLGYLLQQKNKQYRDEAYLILAEIDQKEGDEGSALLHLQLISKKEGSSFFIQANEKIADIYYNLGQFANAQTVYAKLATRSESPELGKKFKLGEMLSLLNQGKFKLFENKLSAFKKSYKKDKMLNTYLAHFDFEIGKFYYQEKKFDPAVRKFERVVKKYKKTEYADDAEYYLGLTYSTINRVEKAQEILTKFSRKYPQSPLLPNIYITLGGLYYRSDKQDLAMEAFKRAVDLAEDPQTRKIALSNLIKMYQDLGLWDGVLAQARKYVEEFPNAADIINKKIIVGSAMVHLNRFSEAIDYLKKAKLGATSDQEPEIQFNIGEAYFNAGQYENAIREFVKIPLLSKQTKLQWEASALYFSGQAYEKLGKIDDAIRMYQEIINRPGIVVDLKREAQKKINQLKSSG